MIKKDKSEIVFAKLSYQIYGICFNVQNKFGRYLSERQYSDALEKEFLSEKIIFVREKELIKLIDFSLPKGNIPDFLIENKIILEIKAKRFITKEDYYQVKRYLTASGLQLGIIINFRQKYLTPKRILNKDYFKEIHSNHSDNNL